MEFTHRSFPAGAGIFDRCAQDDSGMVAGWKGDSLIPACGGQERPFRMMTPVLWHHRGEADPVQRKGVYAEVLANG